MNGMDAGYFFPASPLAGYGYTLMLARFSRSLSGYPFSGWVIVRVTSIAGQPPGR